MDPAKTIDFLPVVSVVIVCYNYGRYLADAVGSVARQTYSKVELLVVDGGSDDPATLQALDLMEDQGVQVYRRGTRRMVGNNRNYGIGRAKGEYVCCLDADDTIRPSYLEKAVLLLENEDLDLVSTSRKIIGSQQAPALLLETPKLEQLLEENQFNTVSVFRKELWNRVGGYEDFGLGEKHFHEDWHFWMKCMHAGASVKNLNFETLFCYRVHSEGSLSKQEGLVPDHEIQSSFIKEEYERLAPMERDRGSVAPGMSKMLAAHEINNAHTFRILIAVNCLDRDTVLGLLEPWVRKNKILPEQLVLLGCKRFEDKEDRLGERLDAITPHHFDIPRSFTGIEGNTLLKYLLAVKGIREIWNVDGALSPELIADCIAFSPFEVVPIVGDQIRKEVTTESQFSNESSNTVTVSWSGNPNSASAGSEVWLLEVRDEGGFLVQTDLFSHENAPAGWRIMNCEASALSRALIANSPATMNMQLRAGSRLKFLCHNWSGDVIVRVGNMEEKLSLFCEKSATREFVVNSESGEQL